MQAIIPNAISQGIGAIFGAAARLYGVIRVVPAVANGITSIAEAGSRAIRDCTRCCNQQAAKVIGAATIVGTLGALTSISRASVSKDHSDLTELCLKNPSSAACTSAEGYSYLRPILTIAAIVFSILVFRKITNNAIANPPQSAPNSPRSPRPAPDSDDDVSSAASSRSASPVEEVEEDDFSPIKATYIRSSGNGIRPNIHLQDENGNIFAINTFTNRAWFGGSVVKNWQNGDRVTVSRRDDPMGIDPLTIRNTTNKTEVVGHYKS